MERKPYKQIFDQIDISTEDSNRIKQVLLSQQASKKVRVRIPKFAVILATVLAISTVGVSAAYYFNLGDKFQAYYNLVFGNTATLSDVEKEIIEQNGVILDKNISHEGVTLTLDGAIGDDNSVYIPYSITLDDKYSESMLNSVKKMQFFAGTNTDKNGLTWKNPLNLYNVNNTAVGQGGYLISSNELSLSNEIVTAILTDTQSYMDTGVNLYSAYVNSDIKASEIDTTAGVAHDIIIPDKGLNLQLQNIYGTSILQSVGYSDNTAVLAIRTTGYYDSFIRVYLRNKQTGEILSRCDGSTGRYSVNSKLSMISFQLNNVDELKNYDLVVEKEYAIDIPLSYKSNAIELCNNEALQVGDIVIDTATVSNLSLSIKGTEDVQKVGIGNGMDTVSLLLKNGDVISAGDLSSSSKDNDGTFIITIRFKKPIPLSDMDSLIIQNNGEVAKILVE